MEHPHDDHTYHGAEPPLSDGERKQLRALLDRDAKARWLASTVRAWGAWAAAAIIGLIAVSDGLRKLIKSWLL